MPLLSRRGRLRKALELPNDLCVMSKESVPEIDRWRKWHPSDEKFDVSPGCEPPKPSEPTFEGFEGATSGQVQNFSDRPPDAPDAWREDFIRWALERCAFREEHDDSAGIGCLLVDFAEWCAAHDAVPERETGVL